MSVTATQAFGQSNNSYDSLVSLFTEWRAFEQPPLREGAPDYTAATFARRHAELPKWQARLAAIEPDGWPIEQQVDWHARPRRDERLRLLRARAAALGSATRRTT